MRTVGTKVSYDPKCIINRGSCGTTVFIGQFEDVKQVALKRIQLTNISGPYLNEAKLMLTVDGHPNIIRYYCCEMDEDFLYIITELCEGTLQDLVEKKYRGPSVGNERELLLQMTRGLSYLHEISIIHRDIKPTNIFITKKYGSVVPPRIKLADFGLSSCLQPDQMDFHDSGGNPMGTRGWMAPELYETGPCDSTVDIFALGCVFGYTLTGGKHPFGDDEHDRMVQIIKRHSILLKQNDFKVASYENALSYFELIKWMVQMNPGERPNVIQVLDKLNLLPQ